MEINTVACDICGVQKKETNHWFVGLSYAVYSAHLKGFYWTDDDFSTVKITLAEAFKQNLKIKNEAPPPHVDLCSRKCVGIFMERHLEHLEGGNAIDPKIAQEAFTSHLPEHNYEMDSLYPVTRKYDGEPY